MESVILILLVLVISVYIVRKVIKAVAHKVKERRLLKMVAKSGIHDIDRMDGYQFEMYLKALLMELGYKSEVTKKSNDFGADLVMNKNGSRVVIQAKRYGIKNRVSISAVQQVYSSMPMYKASESWVMTNSMFTKSAVTLAKACNVKLYDREQLMNFIHQVNPDVSAREIASTVEPKSRKCSECSGELVRRHSKEGNAFMGCTNYPTCSHTESIAKN